MSESNWRLPAEKPSASPRGRTRRGRRAPAAGRPAAGRRAAPREARRAARSALPPWTCTHARTSHPTARRTARGGGRRRACAPRRARPVRPDEEAADERLLHPARRAPLLQPRLPAQHGHADLGASQHRARRCAPVVREPSPSSSRTRRRRDPAAGRPQCSGGGRTPCLELVGSAADLVNTPFTAIVLGADSPFGSRLRPPDHRAGSQPGTGPQGSRAGRGVAAGRVTPHKGGSDAQYAHARARGPALAAAGIRGGAARHRRSERTQRDYVVVYTQGASARPRAGDRAAGGRSSTRTPTSASRPSARRRGLPGQGRRAARARRRRGQPADRPGAARLAKRKREAIEQARRRRPRNREGGQGAQAGKRPRGEPLADLQWDMQQIDATADGSYARQQGSHDVRVGIIDTGIDGSHPDIAPNFDAALTRNFTVDDPIDRRPLRRRARRLLRGPGRRRRERPRHARRRHDRRAAQRPRHRRRRAEGRPRQPARRPGLGLLLPQPDVDALTYAGDNGIDVVNMSFYIDPWLYNCAANPADSPAEQREQRTIIEATQRALDYAHAPRRHADRRRGQRAHRPRPPDVGRHEPGLPAGRAPRHAHGRQLLPDDAHRGRRRDRRQPPGPERPQGVLLQLRHRADRRLGAGRRRPRLPRRRRVPPTT